MISDYTRVIVSLAFYDAQIEYEIEQLGGPRKGERFAYYRGMAEMLRLLYPRKGKKIIEEIEETVRKNLIDHARSEARRTVCTL